MASNVSQARLVTSGVPQGTVLGPLLFLVYINHAVSGLSCSYKIFADDVKLYMYLDKSDLSNGVNFLQSIIDLLIRASESWGLYMNVNKCAVVRFSPNCSELPHTGDSPYKINGNFIKFKESHRDLGITIDRTLKFHSHVKQKVGMVAQLSNNLLSSTICRDADFMMDIYMTHLRPLLEYASPLWNVGYIGDMRLLESIQRRWTRYISDLFEVGYRERLLRLNLFSFRGRLLRADLIYIWKIFNNKCAVQPNDIFVLRPNIANTRGHNMRIFMPHSRLDVRQRFFSVRLINEWNNLSLETV